ncbi:hypothetical protein [Klebsiella sp. PL-2018]|uniref:hypothetical protein n=1 Tax=Klebsiella sp. PL-2018 TaxID=2851540 RepID=UPI001C22F4FD|nr:hypothetical protein [Klebsiella sp. PL-2018]QXD01240.1 hypothetical protein MKleb_5739 [Klebsiella sp. PL-2018]
MYKEQTNKMIKKSEDIQAKQIRAGITHQCRKGWKYAEMSAISVLTGLFLWLALRALFDNNLDAWVGNPEATRVKDMMSVAVYVLPLVFLSFSAATFLMAALNDVLAWCEGGARLLLLRIRNRRASRSDK